MTSNPLFKKLRIQSGMRIAVLHAPPQYAAQLAALSCEVERSSTLSGAFDVVHTFVSERAAVQREAPKLERALAKGGILWVSYPKGKALGTDLNRDILRTTLEAHGFEAVANVAIDAVWSAVRFKSKERS